MGKEIDLLVNYPRAARNVEGRVLLYADKETDSINFCLEEVERRRALQTIYNERMGIVPETIIKPVRDGIESIYEMDYPEVPEVPVGGASTVAEDPAASWTPARLRGELVRLRADMLRAAGELDFEEAARLRDRLKQLEALELKR